MGYRRKVKKTVKKYATKRMAKRLGKKIIGKFIPGYNYYSTVDDVYWAGSATYRFLKRKQVKLVKDERDRLLDKAQRSKSGGHSRRKRYGIDDWY